MDYSNYKRIPLDEHKSLLIGILKNIKSCCEENGITYYLAFGSLLGAIRHKGFIPWDDDVDLLMTREEYNKFRDIFNETNSRYKLIDYDINNNFDSPLPKVVDTDTILTQSVVNEIEPIGVYVDIFILDNLPNGSIKRNIYLYQLTYLQKAWSFIRYKRSYSYSSPLFYLYHLFRIIIKPITVVKILDKHSQKYNSFNTKYVGTNSFSSNRFKYVYLKEWFDEVTYVDFENEEYLTTKYWDDLLRKVYGDYMQLPPPDERVSTHEFEAYYRNK